MSHQNYQISVSIYILKEPSTDEVLVILVPLCTPSTQSYGGIRSIAVGLTLRRLVAKAACAKVVENCGPILAPR